MDTCPRHTDGHECAQTGSHSLHRVQVNFQWITWGEPEPVEKFRPPKPKSKADRDRERTARLVQVVHDVNGIDEPLPDVPERSGEERRDEALAIVFAYAPDVWKEAAHTAIRDVARTRASFTSDAVWEMLRQRGYEQPPEGRAMGALLSAASREGVIEKTEVHIESDRPWLHRRPLRVWKSNLFQGVGSPA